jgi:hypothetical protein
MKGMMLRFAKPSKNGAALKADACRSLWRTNSPLRRRFIFMAFSMCIFPQTLEVQLLTLCRQQDSPWSGTRIDFVIGSSN